MLWFLCVFLYINEVLVTLLEIGHIKSRNVLTQVVDYLL